MNLPKRRRVRFWVLAECCAWLLVAAMVFASDRAEGAYAVIAAVGFRTGRLDVAAALAFPVFWVAALGTELSPGMLGLAGFDYRLFDSLLLGCVLGVASTGIRRPRRPTAVAALLLAAAVVATLSTPLGTPKEAESGLHQLLVAVAAYLLASRVVAREGGARRLVEILVLAGGLAGMKALGVWLSGADIADGPDSVAQAVSRIEPGVLARRILLVGGAPYAVLAVPLGLAYALRKGRGGAWAAAAATVAGAAVVLSLTRANLAACLIGCVLVLLISTGGRRRSGPALPAIVIGLSVLWIFGVALSWQSPTNPVQGALERTASERAQVTSTAFRIEEAESVLDSISGVEWLVGKGLGGEFTPTAGDTGRGGLYVHSWPLWIFLKSGLVGLALAVAGLALATRDLLRSRDGWNQLLAVALLSLLIAWLAVNGLPLAEGELAFGMIAAAGARAAGRSIRRAPVRSSDRSATRSGAR